MNEGADRPNPEHPTHSGHPATPGQRRSRQRRETVLAAAHTLLREGGTTAVTHRRVAEEAHASLSAIRYYFRSREDLLAACLDEMERIRSEEAERALAEMRDGGPRDAEATARAALRISYGPDLSDSGMGGVLWSVVDCVRETPALAQLLAGQRAATETQLAALLEASGRTGVDAELVSSVLDGTALAATIEKSPDAAGVVTAQLAVLIRALED